MIALPYIILTLILFFRHYFSNCTLIYKYSEKIFIYFILSVFFCFRGFIFTDVFNYEPFFVDIVPNFIELIKTKYWKFTWWEPGFVFYCSFIKLLSNSWIVFQVIDSAIDLILLYKALEYFDSNRAENILVFLAMSGMISFIDNIRNIKSILIFFFALRYIYDRKVLKYYFCCFIAFSFHKSSFLYFLIYPILQINVTRRKFLFYGIISIVFAIISKEVFLIVFKSIKNFLPSAFQKLYLAYVMSQGSYALSKVITLGTIEKIIVFNLIYINYNKLSKDKKNSLLVKIFFIYFANYFLFFGFSELSNRLSMLFIFAYWCLIPKLVKLQKKSNQPIFILCILMYCILKMSLYCQPVQRYENFLFGASTIEERLKTFNTNMKD